MASEVALVVSGNRRSTAFDLYEAGIIVYGNMNNIIFLDLRASPPQLLDEKCLMSAHRAKIVALSVLKDKKENEELIVSASEDMVVKVWDLNSRTSIANTEIPECNALSWFSSNAPVVIASEHSNIVKWSYKQGTTLRKIKSGCNQEILLISHNPANNEIIATGHRFGAITVMNVKTENILQKLKVHSKEITSLSWSLVAPDMLLSTSLDMSARVWRMGEAQSVHAYYVSNSRKMDDKKQAKFFGFFYPGSENTMLCCSRGELGTVTFKEKGKPEFQNLWLKGSESLNRNLYILCTWEQDSEGVKKNILCAVEFFRISLFDLEEKRCILSLSTHNNSINKMVVSPTNPNLIVVCCGDGTVKLWNLSTESSSLNCYSIYIQSRVKILCGSFHPVEEPLFAFGTDEGRIGIIDINKKRVLYNFETHHSHACYEVCWGPCSKVVSPEGKSTEDFFLYSCGGGIIHVNKLNEPKSPALDFDELSNLGPELSDCKKNHCHMCWKQDYSCFAVASYKGFVDLYDPQFSFLGRLITPAMSIECLSWHPESTLASPDSSPLKMWLACGGKFNDIHIYDTAEVIDKGEKVMMRPTRKLTGHMRSILSLSWSIHIDGYLASGSRDGTAQIWNAVQGTCIANYPNHRDHVTSVLWNSQNPDIMMSGGLDCCILVKKHKLFRPKPKVSNVEESSVAETASQKSYGETTSEEIHKNKSSKPEGDAASDKTDIDVQEKKFYDVEHLTRKGAVKSWYTKKPPPIFPLFGQDHGVKGIEDCKRLVDLYYSDTTDNSSSFEELKARLPATDEDALKFGIFADQLAALSMLEAQSNQYKKENLPESYAYLQLQMLNVQSVIEEFCKNGKLTDFLVSLAPMVSHKYWLEVCEKFALQLIGDDLYRKGSLYLLMCGKLYEAIQVLAEKGNVYEALALAKAHLPESDPVIEKLLIVCSNKFRSQKCYAFEAQCAIALKDPLSASRILCLLPDPNGARIAAYVCKKFGFETEAENYAFHCLEKCLSHLDWVTAKKLTDEEECMKPYSMLVHVHEIIYSHIRHLKKENGVLVKEIFCNDSADAVPFWKCLTCQDSNQSLISFVYSSLRNLSLLNEEEEFLKNTHEALNTMLNYRKNSDMASEAHISIALYLAQYLVLALKEDFELATKYFLKIFEVSCNIVFLPKIVSMLLLPVELQWSKKTNSVIWEAKKNAADSACPIIHFYGLYSSFGQRIANWEQDEVGTNVISADCLSNLPPLVDTIRNILSGKTIVDLLAAYFSVSFLNDLQSLISKQKPSSECRPLKSPRVRKSIPVASHIVQNGTQLLGDSNSRGSDIRKELEENDDIGKLIELALKEANEKAEQLMGLEKGDKIAEENSANNVYNKVSAEPVHVVENGTLALDNLNHNDSEIRKDLEENNVIEEVSEIALKGVDVKVAEEQSAKNVCTNVDSEPVNHCVISTNGVCDATSSISDVLCSNTEMVTGVSKKDENNFVKSSLKDGENSSDVENISSISEGGNIEKYSSLNCVTSSEEENVTNGVAGNVSAIHESIIAENDMKLGETSDGCMIAQFSATQKLEDEDIPKETAFSHEQCLEEISSFCNIVKLMFNIVCRDEFALFFYLQDLVNYINQEMASTSKIAPRSGEQTASQTAEHLENDLRRDGCDTKVIPQEQKQTELLPLSAVQSGDGKSNSDLGNEPNEEDSSSLLKSSAHLGDLKNDGQINGCDNEVKVKELTSLNPTEDTPESKSFYDSNGKDIEPSSDKDVEPSSYKDIEPPKIVPTLSNELQTESDNEMICSKMNGSESFENTQGGQSELQTVDTADFIQSKLDKSGAPEHVLVANQVTAIAEKEGEELQKNSEYEHGEKVSEEKHAVDSNHISSSKNAKYQEEKKKLLELIAVLESEHKEKPYPNPFIAASKAVQSCSDVYHKSACHQVQRKVHELAHEVLGWVEKFAINQKPCLSCQICKNVTYLHCFV
ncbi:uncharacterized protein LOC129216825 [Uloborus diversus]|uniref:uncharacterized protein LOC129216825 n=1 Tax=Uloborus diversus TaxID=327109 RepID=UPI002409AD5B|nr:uncharacterized protein LOC129216825 [Uloborus diversus]